MTMPCIVVWIPRFARNDTVVELSCVHPLIPVSSKHWDTLTFDSSPIKGEGNVVGFKLFTLCFYFSIVKGDDGLVFLLLSWVLGLRFQVGAFGG